MSQNPKSVLVAIREGNWNYEPEHQHSDEFGSTEAMPGSNEKLDILASRVNQGLPLWHPSDRLTYDGSDSFE